MNIDNCSNSSLKDPGPNLQSKIEEYLSILDLYFGGLSPELKHAETPLTIETVAYNPEIEKNRAEKYHQLITTYGKDLENVGEKNFDLCGLLKLDIYQESTTTTTTTTAVPPVGMFFAKLFK